MTITKKVATKKSRCVGCGQTAAKKCLKCGRPTCGRAVGLCGHQGGLCAVCVGKALAALFE